MAAKELTAVQAKVELIRLSEKFNISEGEDGKTKVEPKDEGANLNAFITEDGKYEVFPTTTEAPLNIPALNDVVKFCKLMTK